MTNPRRGIQLSAAEQIRLDTLAHLAVDDDHGDVLRRVIDRHYRALETKGFVSMSRRIGGGYRIHVTHKGWLRVSVPSLRALHRLGGVPQDLVFLRPQKGKPIKFVTAGSATMFKAWGEA